jgi:Protein of unknown function (DUF2971)
VNTNNLWKPIIPKDSAKIWRYMDFAKFISLLDKKALFFSRADKLGDPFEGSFPEANVKKRQKLGNEFETLGAYYRIYIKLTVINCWHLNEYESDAMWKLYTQNGEGIAIQSTVGRLTSSLNKYKFDPVDIFRVEYRDYKKVEIPEGTLSPYFHKRKSFEHEKELRAVIQRLFYKPNGEIDFEKTPFKNGIYVPVNLSNLIENLYLSPTCPIWQKEILDSLVNKYGPNISFKQSQLIEKPEY